MLLVTPFEYGWDLVMVQLEINWTGFGGYLKN